MDERTGHHAVDELSNEATATGSLAELGVLDLLQAISDTKRSAALRISSAEQRADLFFRDGDLIDAELGSLRGERAVYAALTWNEGQFEVDFGEVPREDAMRTSTRRVLWEGRRRQEERTRRMARLPDLGSVFEVDCAKLLEKLAELPDEMNLVLKHFDGDRPLVEILSHCELDELTTLSAFARLIAEGVIQDLHADGPGAVVGADRPARGRPPPVISTLPPPRATVRSTLDYELEAHAREAAAAGENGPSPEPEGPRDEPTLRGLRAPRVATNPPLPVGEPPHAIGDASQASQRVDAAHTSHRVDASHTSHRVDASQASQRVDAAHTSQRVDASHDSELDDGSEDGEFDDASQYEPDTGANSRPTVRVAPPDAELYLSSLAPELTRRRRRRRRRATFSDAPSRRLRSFANLGPETPAFVSPERVSPAMTAALRPTVVPAGMPAPRDEARSPLAALGPIGKPVAPPVPMPLTTDRSITKDRASAERSITKDRASAERSITKDRPSTEHASTEHSFFTKEHSPTEQSSTQRASAERSITKDRPSADRSVTKDRPSTERSVTKDRPSTERSVTKDRPSADRSVTKDRPSADRSVTKDRPSADRSVTKDRPSADRSPTTERSPAMRSRVLPVVVALALVCLLVTAMVWLAKLAGE